MPAVYEPLWYPAAYRGRYPHMAKRDAAVWEQFIALYGERYEAYAYDVALGGIAGGLHFLRRDDDARRGRSAPRSLS